MGIAAYKCERCGRFGAHMSQYNLNLCRQCFREIAEEIGFNNTVNMSQDVVADALNQMMNALRAKHTSVTVKRYSKPLLSVLAIAKLKGYVTSYKTEGNH